MPSKFHLLREGKAVEVEPGVSARLNKKNKRLELSTGEHFDVSTDKNLYPANERELSVSKEKEQIQRGIGENPLGEFGYQFSQKGLLGGAKDIVDFATQGQNYINRKQAQNEVSEEISEESPWTSAAATAASFAPDIALTGGMSALKAAPLLTAASSGSRLFTEPTQVAGEAALAGAGGFLLDKAGGFLNRVAQRRAASRELPSRQAEVRAQNTLGKQQVENANLQESQKFNALQERTRNENSALLHQHNLTLNDRQNKMIQAQNAYEQAKANRESEIFRLKNEYETAKAQRSSETARLENAYKTAKSSAEQETRRLNEDYKLAQKQYEESVSSLPKLQKEAQSEHSKNVINTSKEIEKLFPKESKIHVSQIAPEEFIEQSIRISGLSGSREGNQAARIIRSLFPEGEAISSRELSRRYQAIEEAIQRANPEVQKVLSEFKNHLGEKLPSILEDSISHGKIIPLLQRNVEKDVNSILSRMKGVDASAISNIRSGAKSAIDSIESNDFINRLQNGQITQELIDKISNIENFIPGVKGEDAKKLLNLNPKSNFYEGAQGLINQARERQQQFISQLQQKMNNDIARYEIKAMQSAGEASRKIGKPLKGTYGLAEPIPIPGSPLPPSPVSFPTPPEELPAAIAPNFPAQVNPPQSLPMPQKPSLNPNPTAPIPKTFSAQSEPTLSAPQTGSEHIGDFLEKNLLGGKSLVNNPLTKLAGLKYLLGKAAVPAEGAYLGLKGLTSPTSGGEFARLSFKQAGIQAIEQLAQKYPSYHNGVIDNPQERRSLTKEIEEDSEIPLEEKALIQSKINRGKPLQDPIS